MTKIASFAAIALTTALVAGFVQFAPSVAQALTEVATVDSIHAAPMSASQKTKCMMPSTQWKGCGA